MTTPAKITRYTLGPDHDPVNIEYAGHGKWAIRRRSECLSHSGEWSYEPLPSSRTDEFLAVHRWDDVENAIDRATVALYMAQKMCNHAYSDRTIPATCILCGVTKK